MNIENIEAFVYVIHFGGFNKAAEALFLSQPSVTARIKSLEQELNCKLFERAGKQVQISEDGKRFLPYAQQLLLVYKTGKLQIHQKKSQQNEYRIGCTVSAANYVIPDLLPYLNERFPLASYKLVTGTSDDIVAKVLNKDVDIALVRKAHHPGLQSVKFYVDPIRLYVYQDHPFLRQERITVEEVAEQPLVFFECGSLDWLRIHRVFESLEQPPNIRIQTDNSEMARKLIVRKSGIGFMPGLSVRQEVSAGMLYPLLLPETEGIALQTNVVVLPGEHAELFEAVTQFGKIIGTLDF
ncbi:LysR family transcriptional regulator [Paenibacillus sp. LHD-117]|uniref:LysR family transcriptional regulator n=1 Tax=Paenibacillus sp. LHD-117 TaxID=3071412 RepID=UPI0027DFE504|nr:LysR family transcriptional regulator [Paenibacillus sp. LHD-117]MDQ6419314.1 LysR family transcriptional regulator [Paenibacillus sp. LHD-117]